MRQPLLRSGPEHNENYPPDRDIKEIPRVFEDTGSIHEHKNKPQLAATSQDDVGIDIDNDMKFEAKLLPTHSSNPYHIRSGIIGWFKSWFQFEYAKKILGYLFHLTHWLPADSAEGFMHSGLAGVDPGNPPKFIDTHLKQPHFFSSEAEILVLKRKQQADEYFQEFRINMWEPNSRYRLTFEACANVLKEFVNYGYSNNQLIIIGDGRERDLIQLRYQRQIMLASLDKVLILLEAFDDYPIRPDDEWYSKVSDFWKKVISLASIVESHLRKSQPSLGSSDEFEQWRMEMRQRLQTILYQDKTFLDHYFKELKDGDNRRGHNTRCFEQAHYDNYCGCCKFIVLHFPLSYLHSGLHGNVTVWLLEQYLKNSGWMKKLYLALFIPIGLMDISLLIGAKITDLACSILKQPFMISSSLDYSFDPDPTVFDLCFHQMCREICRPICIILWTPGYLFFYGLTLTLLWLKQDNTWGANRALMTSLDFAKWGAIIFCIFSFIPPVIEALRRFLKRIMVKKELYSIMRGKSDFSFCPEKLFHLLEYCPENFLHLPVMQYRLDLLLESRLRSDDVNYIHNHYRIIHTEMQAALGLKPKFKLVEVSHLDNKVLPDNHLELLSLRLHRGDSSRWYFFGYYYELDYKYHSIRLIKKPRLGERYLVEGLEDDFKNPIAIEIIPEEHLSRERGRSIVYTYRVIPPPVIKPQEAMRQNQIRQTQKQEELANLISSLKIKQLSLSQIDHKNQKDESSRDEQNFQLALAQELADNYEEIKKELAELQQSLTQQQPKENEQHPSILAFQKILRLKLSNAFATSFALAHDLASPSKGKVGKLISVMTMFTFLIPIPYVSQAIGLCKFVGDQIHEELQKNDHRKHNLNMKTLGEASLLINKLTDGLIYRYQFVIFRLTPQSLELFADCLITRMFRYVELLDSSEKADLLGHQLVDLTQLPLPPEIKADSSDDKQQILEEQTRFAENLLIGTSLYTSKASLRLRPESKGSASKTANQLLDYVNSDDASLIIYSADQEEKNITIEKICRAMPMVASSGSDISGQPTYRYCMDPRQRTVQAQSGADDKSANRAVLVVESLGVMYVTDGERALRGLEFTKRWPEKWPIPPGTAMSEVEQLRNENRTLRDENSTLKVKITNLEGENQRLVRIPTKGGGDCALHAILGEWNPEEHQLICADIKGKREQVRAAIVNKDNKEPLQGLIMAGIKELVMSGRNIGESSQALVSRYRRFISDQKDFSSVLWPRFEAVLRQYLPIMEYIQKKHHLLGNPSLRDQFYDALNQNEGELYGRILSLPALHEAFQEYSQLQNTEFDWDSAISTQVKQEYADFVGTAHVWLLPSELAIIANVFHVSVIYYPSLSALSLTLNPGEQSTVVVQFNGSDHFERLQSNNDVAAIILPGNQVPKEVYQEITSKKGHTPALTVNPAKVYSTVFSVVTAKNSSNTRILNQQSNLMTRL